MTTDTPVKSTDFTHTQARMILECSEAYDPQQVKRAALWMLGDLTAAGHELAMATRALS